MSEKSASSSVEYTYRAALDSFSEQSVKRCKSPEEHGCGRLLPIERFVKRTKVNCEGQLYYQFESWCKECENRRKANRQAIRREKRRTGRIRMAYDKKSKNWLIYVDGDLVARRVHEYDAVEFIHGYESGARVYEAFFKLPAPPLKWCRESQEMMPR